MYSQAQQKFMRLKGRDDILVLGIESSCDETAAAVARGNTPLADVVASQIELHQRFGGVVPEVASRNHTLAVLGVVDEALKTARVTLDQIDAIAVTSHPGLIGSLLVGVSTAKALSMAKGIPLINVNHIEAHICANYLPAQPEPLKPPFMALVASGGHTSFIDVTGYNAYKVVGGTVDDAIGEAFDKVARLLGLPYPGGPNVDKLAAKGTANITFTKRKGINKELMLSYSGLKTAVVNYVHNLKQKTQSVCIEDVCASFTKESVDMLTATLLEAARRHNRDTVAIAGGVAANSFLRSRLLSEAQNGLKVFIPPPALCTDNASMVAVRGFYSAFEGFNCAGLDLNAKSTM